MRLSPGEMALFERLVEAGALIAVPQLGSAKPRRVVAASLEPAGDRILLYLSAKPTELMPHASERGSSPRHATRAKKSDDMR